MAKVHYFFFIFGYFVTLYCEVKGLNLINDKKLKNPKVNFLKSKVRTESAKQVQKVHTKVQAKQELVLKSMIENSSICI